MQFLTVLLALTATAVAAPNGDSSESWKCTFGEYECDKSGDSIKQCSIDGKWVTIGPCPYGTSCAYDEGNDLPYCFADEDETKDEKKRGVDHYPVGSCSKPGSYVCSPDWSGIEVCDSSYQLEWNGACPYGTVCKYLPDGAAGQIPFCVTKGW